MAPTFEIFGFIIPTYYLVLSLTATLSVIVLEIRRQRKFHYLGRDKVLNVFLLTIVCGFLGGRLTHVFLEYPQMYFARPMLIVLFWYGGFVFYGGFIFAVLSVAFYLRRDQRKGMYFDLFAPVLALSYSLGRWACFFAGCCYGRSCDLPWAVHGLHPTQLYAVGGEFLVMLVLLFVEAKKYFSRNGNLFVLWLILHGFNRLIMEYFRDDFRGPVWILTPSSWFSVGLVCYGLWHLRSKTNVLNP